MATFSRNFKVLHIVLGFLFLSIVLLIIKEDLNHGKVVEPFSHKQLSSTVNHVKTLPEAPTSVSNDETEEIHAKEISLKLQALRKLLVEMESKGAEVLFRQTNEKSSTLMIKLKKPTPQFIQESEVFLREATSKIIQLNNNVEKSNLFEKISEIKDFLHWTSNSETGVEYNDRSLSISIIYGQKEKEEELSGIITEAASIEGVATGMKAQGNSVKRLLSGENLNKRYGHLFKLGDQN